jgi:hypothetical protein
MTSNPTNCQEIMTYSLEHKHLVLPATILHHRDLFARKAHARMDCSIIERLIVRECLAGVRSARNKFPVARNNGATW